MPLPRSLRPLILDILSKSDLESVTPRALRGDLINIQRSHNISPPADTTRRIPSEFDFEANKKAVTSLIKECYDDVAAQQQQQQHKAPEVKAEPPAEVKPKLPALNGSSNGGGGLALPGLGGVRGDSASAATPKASPPDAIAAQSASDAALAAKLQQQYSASAGPSTRGGATTNGSSSSAKKRKKSKKADADEIDSQEDSDIDSASASPAPGSRKAKKTKSSSTRASNPNNPFNRPVLLDAAMADICGGDEMPRHAVVKQLWAYVKGRDLQNPSNRRQIMCDDKLKNLFGKSVVDSFEMSKLISNHVRKKEDVLP